MLGEIIYNFQNQNCLLTEDSQITNNNIMNLLAQVETEVNILNNVGDQYKAFGNLSLGALIGGFITVIMIVAAVVFFFMLVIGGLRWITSGGDKGQTEGARNQITAALVGLIIVFGAFAIASLVDSLFGINVFSFNLPQIVGETVVKK